VIGRLTVLLEKKGLKRGKRLRERGGKGRSITSSEGASSLKLSNGGKHSAHRGASRAEMIVCVSGGGGKKGKKYYH